MDKAQLRTEVKARLAALKPARRALEEELVTAAVQALPEWRAARCVLLYRSVAPEFSTVGLANAAWREGKTTVFPAVDGERLLLRQAAGWSEFKPGWRGIPEPQGVAVETNAIDLAIVPGVAFTETGHRLGRGGGHYDRLLADLSCPVLAVAFDCQIVPAVPLQAHDQAVAKVVHAAGQTSQANL